MADFDFKLSSKRRSGEASDEDVTFPVEDYREDVKNGESDLVVDTHETPNIVIVENVYALIWRSCAPLV